MVSPVDALGLVSNWLSAAFADPHAHGAAISEVTGTLSALLGATQAVAASLLAPAVPSQVQITAAAPAGSLQDGQAAPGGPSQVGPQSSQALARPDVRAEAEVEGDSDQAMGSEAEDRAESGPIDPRAPPPDAKKPRCGDPPELIIAT